MGIVVIESLFDKERHEFFIWAFGYPERSQWDIEYMNSWNEHHSDILMLRSTDNVAESIEKMIKLWREHES